MLNTLDTTRHKGYLLRILKDVYSDTELAPFLGFKGGTAAFLFYGLDRFSVDLDFDLLNIDKEDLLFSRIGTILKIHGTLKEARKKRYSLFFILAYAADGKKIKIEINRRSFGSQYELKNYLGISMLVMTRDDMFAHKIVAMMERLGKSNRDIYDIWFFLKKNWPLNKDLVEQRTKKIFKKFIVDCIKALEHVSDRHILSGVGELLDDTQKKWAKANLRKETVFFLKTMIA